MSTYTGVTNCQKQSGFFWPTLYILSHTVCMAVLHSGVVVFFFANFAYFFSFDLGGQIQYIHDIHHQKLLLVNLDLGHF